MCGRYITPDEAALERHWSYVPPLEFRQNFNTAPSQLAPIVRLDKDGKPDLSTFTWGFQPSWAKRSWINARSETVFESKAFKSAAAKRRCLVPAIGWYEWQGSQSPKRPFAFHLDGFRPFAFAGIWTAREIESGWNYNFAILTRAAEPYLERIHNRMPVVLSPEDYDAWLSPDTSPSEAQALIHGPPDIVKTYEVSTLVNKPQNNGPECIRPLDRDTA